MQTIWRYNLLIHKEFHLFTLASAPAGTLATVRHLIQHSKEGQTSFSTSADLHGSFISLQPIIQQIPIFHWAPNPEQITFLTRANRQTIRTDKTSDIYFSPADIIIEYLHAYFGQTLYSSSLESSTQVSERTNRQYHNESTVLLALYFLEFGHQNTWSTPYLLRTHLGYLHGCPGIIFSDPRIGILPINKREKTERKLCHFDCLPNYFKISTFPH